LSKKSGRLSKSEIEYIDLNLESMSDTEIAAAIERSPDAVAQRRANQPQTTANSQLQSFIVQLRSKHFWTTIKRSLLDSEISDFENGWAALYAQFFHQGVTATDEMMMKDVVIDDIMLHRALEEKRNILQEIKDNEVTIERLKMVPIANRSQEDVDEAINAHRTVVQLRGAQVDYTKEINDIKRTKDSKFKDLKATRNERLKTVEEAGKNIFAMIKFLDERKQRESEGRMSSLVFEASRRKQLELEENTQFSGGEVDRPWLTPESELRHAKETNINTEAKASEDTEE